MLEIKMFVVFCFALTTFTAQIAVKLYLFEAVRLFLFAISFSYFVHYSIMNVKYNVLVNLQMANYAIEFYMNAFFMPITFRHQFHKV